MDRNHYNAIKANKRPSHGRLQKFRVDRVFEHAGVNVLDYGCATGDYVQLLKKNGYNAQGVDVLDFGYDWEVRDIQEDCKMIDGDPRHLPERKFDTILLFEVLEHVKEPLAFLKDLKEATRGNLILTVPNCEDSNLLTGSGLNFNHYTDSSHVNFFDQKNLERLLLEAGFQINLIEKANQVNLLRPTLASIGLSGRMLSQMSRIGFLLPKKAYMTLFAVVNR